ncbi:bacteriohemerythrin [Natroniella acetigena]|uniref:bacteriohemerythrin n=1 Tax=Natroniella acetigena TaxID=52004 RepID=UPI00200AB52C|nr:bacteriohemerythrin [Natroniella acetigena]MCK8826765.1 bacteriohemerythrin [Natroniella acetigena]
MLWKEKYKIGIEKVDQQHKEIFNRLNNFLNVVRNDEEMKSKLEEIEKTLDFMGQYVVVHFDSEEKVQQEYNYPHYEEHKEVHDRFKEEIINFKQEFEADKYNEDLVMEFSGRLLTWLINHVADEDQKIADYIQK